MPLMVKGAESDERSTETRNLIDPHHPHALSEPGMRRSGRVSKGLPSLCTGGDSARLVLPRRPESPDHRDLELAAPQSAAVFTF